jgi:hypothetical protein
MCDDCQSSGDGRGIPRPHFTDELAVRCVAKVKKLATASLRVAASSGTGALVVRNGRLIQNYAKVRFGHVQHLGELT